VCILHVDLGGCEQLRGSKFAPICVWVTPPDVEALRQRLQERGIRDPEEIEARLAQAHEDMESASGEKAHEDMESASGEKAVLFDFTLENADVDGV
ncbi:hypothetical protein T484DRAFT_1833355, partial [Baffinella frigidus]